MNENGTRELAEDALRGTVWEMRNPWRTMLLYEGTKPLIYGGKQPGRPFKVKVPALWIFNQHEANGDLYVVSVGPIEVGTFCYKESLVHPLNLHDTAREHFAEFLKTYSPDNRAEGMALGNLYWDLLLEMPEKARAIAITMLSQEAVRLDL